MENEKLEELTRREFLRREVLRTGGLVFAAMTSPSLLHGAEIRPTTRRSNNTIFDIPGLSVEVNDWKPLDITDEVKKAMKEEDKFLFNPRLFGNPLHSTRSCQSRDENWAFSSLVRKTEVSWVSVEGLFGKNYGSRLLFDNRAQKIYTVDMEDDKVVGSQELRIPNYDSPTTNRPVKNGSIVYVTEKKDEPIFIIADFKNLRKIIFKKVDKKVGHSVSLSQEGNRGCIEMYLDNPLDRLYVFDINTGKVEYQKDTRFLAMNDNGSVVIHGPRSSVLSGATSYHRADLSRGDDRFIWDRNYERNCFTLSPDGNFCGCQVEHWGPSTIEVYDHANRKYFVIDHPTDKDAPLTIENDGTLHARSGTYKYKDGTYNWATENKEEPKGLIIIK